MWNDVGIENVINIGAVNGIVPVDGKLQQHGSILQFLVDGKLGVNEIKISTQIRVEDGRNAPKHFMDIGLPFPCLQKTHTLWNIALGKKAIRTQRCFIHPMIPPIPH